jgi:transcriptional regulator with PAS, ATPase and Fis domain
MKSDMNDLKKLVYDLIQRGEIDIAVDEAGSSMMKNLFRETRTERAASKVPDNTTMDFSSRQGREDIQDTEEIVEESLSLAGKEVEMIKKALEKYNGKRKMAAHELGISERTLYRKIKEYGIEM